MLKGLRAVITGASSGIGKTTAAVFVQEGAQVFATGRNESALQELKQNGHCSAYLAGDLTDDAFIEKMYSSAAEFFGGSFTTVVNSAGVLIATPIGSANATAANYDANFNANTRPVYLGIVHSVPYLRKAAEAGAEVGSLSFTNISSVTGLQSFGGVSAYCGSKAAADIITQSAAVDLAPDGIRVNTVNPGVTRTPLQRRGGQTEEQYAAFVTRSLTTHPLAGSPSRAAVGGIATPEEVANAVAFLASPKVPVVMLCACSLLMCFGVSIRIYNVI